MTRMGHVRSNFIARVMKEKICSRIKVLLQSGRWFRGGLICQTHILLHHSPLGFSDKEEAEGFSNKEEAS